MILSPREPVNYAVASAYQLRPLNSRRITRLRVAWFVLGTIVGAAAGIGASKFSSHSSDAVKTAEILPADVPSPATDTASAAPTTLPPAIDSPAPAINEPAALVAPQPAQATPAAAETPPPAKPAITYPATLAFKMPKRETVVSMLVGKNVTQDEATRANDALKKVLNPKLVTRGMPVTLILGPNSVSPDKASITSVTFEESPLRTVSLSRTADGDFSAKEIKSPIFKGLTHAGGTIRSSLYQTAIDSGIPVKMVSEIIQAFSYDVDFQRDIHRGDRLDVVFERTHNDKNVTTSVGKMMFASLTLDGETYTVYRHTSADGYSGFYNAKGESIRKALLKTPINGAHVTSSFGMRMHPLLGYSKMHKGIDFGAPTGTPIYAAGDGVIEEAGRRGGYGNYVRLRHNNTYATAYGHASRIAKGIRPGAHVKQGQIIAYVGSTGQSTGPHLHYEILLNGAQINPTGVKFRTGQTLTGREFAAFRKEIKQIESAMAAAPRKTQLAALP